MTKDDTNAALEPVSPQVQPFKATPNRHAGETVLEYAPSALLAEFVESFELLDDMLTFEPVPPELHGISEDFSMRMARWKPARIRTDPAALAAVYPALPGPFPPLYEELVLSYRWLEVNLGEIICLLANAPADSLLPLLKEITEDRSLIETLLPMGFVPFGKAAGGCYDPICFDTRRRDAAGDCPIVRIEHEAILCNQKIGDSWKVADSFRQIVEMTIARVAKECD